MSYDTVLHTYGNKLYWCDDEKVFRLEDGTIDQVYDEEYNLLIQYDNKIKCPKCKVEVSTKYTEEDPCLGHLPGVKFACCGHGVKEGYISFSNGVIIRGKFSIEYEKEE